ncbi:hypothetical protein BJP25_15870 [Actinokineospora bangkokensis]|uniref:OmpR/PhoB-type domain-containing protein n=1 Tax=Actinokineospora bangkokensis TaxID=1193682 RepID=A0A1Q9LPK1_9PSEU|nr:hypothetical protein BJP25_15870 [Actinokineospora bangkokensis]
MRFLVLGPVAAEAGGPVDLRGPRQRAVLARLLVARGRVVPTSTLVDDLWTHPPAGAVGAVRTFVGDLRRALEPERLPRTPPRLLVTEGPGYALRPGAVDAWEFEDLLARPDPSRSDLSRVDAALALWRGPAYADVADEPWAVAEARRLDELRLHAVEQRAAALLDLGRAAEAVADLRAHTAAHPLREGAWNLLARALYRADRQGEALSALRDARRVLAEELGVDPGPDLRALEADILAHAPSLGPGRAAVARPVLLGREAEQEALLAAADSAVGTRFVLLSGDAGIGKTALAQWLDAELRARGWTTAWGSSTTDDDQPPAWPWTRVLDTLGAPAPAEPTAFAQRRAVVALLARYAPLLLVLDDLHWATPETLAQLTALITDPPPARLLVLATHRDTPGLVDLRAALARTDPLRLRLTGLPARAAGDLVRAATGRDLDRSTADALHRRAGGNPFYLRELARWHDEGAGADDVPPGIRDVVRQRLAGVPEQVREVLRLAAVTGDDLDLLDEPGLLDALEHAAAAGFLVETPPRGFAFAHDLVRSAIAATLSATRRAVLHADVAARLERLRPRDAAALAHHHLRAATPASAARAVGHARTAAQRAERAFAPHQAVRLWQTALDAHAASGTDDEHLRLELLMGHVRALAYTGDLAAARRGRASAVDAAARLGDAQLTTRVLGAFDVPALWTDPDDPELSATIAATARATLDALPEPTPDRARVLATLALELRNTDMTGAAAAAREAAAIPHDDPALRALVLNAHALTLFDHAGMAPQRARAADALIAAEPIGHRVLGHLVALQAHCALADLGAADAHALSADRLAAEHGLPLVGVFTAWYRALRLSITGHPAEGAYRAAAAALPGSGMTGLEPGILALALHCDRLQRGGPPLVADFGPHEPWCRPGPAPPPPPRDLLFEVRSCLRARAAVARADQALADEVHDALLPAAGELAAGSGLVTLGPVAQHLGDLAVVLGRPGQAREHYARALAVAERAGSPHAVAAARAGLRADGAPGAAPPGRGR